MAEGMNMERGHRWGIWEEVKRVGNRNVQNMCVYEILKV